MAGYSVTYGSSAVYTPGSDERAIHDAKLSMRTDEVSTFTFTMPPTHPLRDSLSLRSGIIRVRFDEQLLFCGFVTRMVATITGELVVTCDSDLAMLADVHMRLTDLTGQYSNKPYAMTAKDLFEKVIAIYNSRVASAREFTIGHNVGANEVGTVVYNGVRSVSVDTTTPTTALDIIKRCILDPYDCVLKVWYPEGVRTIGLYTAAPDSSGQHIRFGENMTSLEIDTSDEDFYTGCYPIGGDATDYSKAYDVDTFTLTQAVAVNGIEYHVQANSKYDWVSGDDDWKIGYNDIFVIDGISLYGGPLISGEMQLFPVNRVDGQLGTPKAFAAGTTVHYKGASPGMRETRTVTLDDIPNGTYYGDYRVSGALVYNSDAVSAHGLRTFAMSESIFYAPDLLARAVGQVQERMAPSVTIRVDGVDMALYDQTKQHLVAGQKVTVDVVPYGISGLVMQVTQADLDLDNPGSTKYTLGPYPFTMTRKMRENATDIDALRKELRSFKVDTVSSSDIARLN